jgi:hypothetical protein
MHRATRMVMKCRIAEQRYKIACRSGLNVVALIECPRGLDAYIVDNSILPEFGSEYMCRDEHWRDS